MSIPNHSFANDFNKSWSPWAFVSVASDKIYVTNNGVEYTHASSEVIFTSVNIEMNSPLFGNIKSWKVWLTIRQGENGNLVEFNDTPQTASYPLGQRPDTVDTTREMTITPEQYSELFKFQCNNLADNLRSQGYTNQQIYSENREIDFEIEANSSGVVTGAIAPGFASMPSYKPNFTLVCKKSSGPQQPAAGAVKPNTQDVKVTYSNLTVIEKSTLQGVCKVTLSGVIQTDKQNGKVRFKYKHHPSTGNDFQWSDEYEVNTGQSKTAMFSHEFDVPIIIGEETGIMQIIGTDPVFESVGEHYAMNCTKAPASNIQQPLPPTLNMQVVPQNEVTMSNGEICPTKLLMVADIVSKNTEVEGALFFYNNNYQSEHQEVNIGAGKKRKVLQIRDLSWDQFSSTSGNTGTYAVEGASNTIRSQPITLGYSIIGDNYMAKFNFPPKSFLVSCRKPVVNQHIYNNTNKNLNVDKPNHGTHAPAQQPGQSMKKVVPNATIVVPEQQQEQLKQHKVIKQPAEKRKLKRLKE
ncbi:MAG: hypothetical protein AB8B92_01835 [Gammaproteobacteria bacterium]